MIKSLTNFPLNFKKALIKDLLLTKEEIILQTIYNEKCLSLKSLWNVLPKEEFIDDFHTRSELKSKYLQKMLDNGELVRDRAPDFPQFKKSGYAVDVKQAYKERLPYTMMGLNPLPALERIDYIYHLFLYKDHQVPYQVFPDEKHEMLDKLFLEVLNLKEAKDPESDVFGKKKYWMVDAGLTGIDKSDTNTLLDYNYKIDAYRKYQKRIEKYLI